MGHIEKFNFETVNRTVNMIAAKAKAAKNVRQTYEMQLPKLLEDNKPLEKISNASNVNIKVNDKSQLTSKWL